MDKAVEKIIEGLVELGFKLVGLILILAVGFRLVKVLLKALNKSRGFNRLDKSVQTFINSFANIVLKVLVFITALAYVGIPMTSMLAVFSSATLAVGLALQGGLSNVAGGMMILIFKPFKVGDYIETHSDSGEVVAITIFYTVLKTPDNKKIVLPNGALTNEPITNYSSYDTRRVDWEFSVSYDADIEKVKSIIEKELENEELILKDNDLFVRYVRKDTSSLVFVARAWALKENYWTVKYNIEESVKIAFDKNNIEIPYPKMDIHVNNK